MSEKKPAKHTNGVCMFCDHWTHQEEVPLCKKKGIPTTSLMSCPDYTPKTRNEPPYAIIGTKTFIKMEARKK